MMNSRELARSPNEPQPRAAWLRRRFFGLTSLAFAAAGQLIILLAIAFAPEEPIYERPTEEHWTDDIAVWWLLFSALAGVLALVGLVADKRRGTAAIALLAAFVGLVWPWG